MSCLGSDGRSAGPVEAAVLDRLEGRGEAGALVCQLNNSDLGTTTSEGSASASIFALRSTRIGQELDRFAQAHVVGEATAEAQLLQEFEPAEPLLLIAAQLAAEAGRLVGRLDADASFELVAQFEEFRVVIGLGLGGQQRVEQRDGVRREADVVLRRAWPGSPEATTARPTARAGCRASRRRGGPSCRRGPGRPAGRGGGSCGRRNRCRPAARTSRCSSGRETGGRSAGGLFCRRRALASRRRPARGPPGPARGRGISMSRPVRRGSSRRRKPWSTSGQPGLLFALFVPQDAAAERPLGNGPLRARGADHRAHVIEQDVPLQPVAVQQGAAGARSMRWGTGSQVTSSSRSSSGRSSRGKAGMSSRRSMNSCS